MIIFIFFAWTKVGETEGHVTLFMIVAPQGQQRWGECVILHCPPHSHRPGQDRRCFWVSLPSQLQDKLLVSIMVTDKEEGTGPFSRSMPSNLTTFSAGKRATKGVITLGGVSWGKEPVFFTLFHDRTVFHCSCTSSQNSYVFFTNPQLRWGLILNPWCTPLSKSPMATHRCPTAKHKEGPELSVSLGKVNRRIHYIEHKEYFCFSPTQA